MHGKELEGKRIVVSKAKPKRSQPRTRADGPSAAAAADDDNDDDDAPAAKPAKRAPRVVDPAEAAAVAARRSKSTDWRERTAVVWGLPPGTAERVIRVRARKMGKVERIRIDLKAPGAPTLPAAAAPAASDAAGDEASSSSSAASADGAASPSSSSPSPAAASAGEATEQRVVAHVTMTTKDDCNKLCKHLDGRSIKDRRVAARPLSLLLPQQVARRRGRVIVRNVPFGATERELWDMLDAAGPLASVHLPTVSVKKGQDAGAARSGRGFAFGQFVTREDAVRAVQYSGAGKTKIKGRAVVVDFATDKAVYEANKRAADERAAEAADVAASDSDSGSSSDEEDGEEEAGKEDDEADGSDAEAEDGADDEEDDEDKPMTEEEAEAEAEAQAEAEAEAEAAAEAAAEAEASGDEGRDEGPRVAPNDVGEGCTVFLRNVAFDATDADLRATFARYGTIEFAAVVKDRSTGAGKGTAFVKFSTAEEAAAAIDGCEAYDPATMGAGVSLEAAAGLATGEVGLSINGRRLVAKLAVDKASASDLKAASIKRKDGSEGARWERRHLYLAKEGQLHGQALADIPESDREKREKAVFEAKARLKAPVFFVSPLRLSVRNLSRAMDERALRKLCRDSAVEGMRAGLVVKGEGDPSLRPEAGSRPSVKLVKATLFRETALERAERKGAAAAAEAAARNGVAGAEGKTLGASKGFAFVEFSQHVHALACLRRLNNNPAMAWAAAGGKAAMGRTEEERSRLIVSFAIENASKLKIRERRQELAKKKRDAETKVFGSEDKASKARNEGREKREVAGKARAEKRKQDWEGWTKTNTAGGGAGGEDGEDAEGRGDGGDEEAAAGAGGEGEAAAASAGKAKRSKKQKRREKQERRAAKRGRAEGEGDDAGAAEGGAESDLAAPGADATSRRAVKRAKAQAAKAGRPPSRRMRGARGRMVAEEDHTDGLERGYIASL